MKVTSHAEHIHEHGDSCNCGEQHSHVQVQLKQTLIGLLFVIKSWSAAELSPT